MPDSFESFMSGIEKKTEPGIMRTPQEMKENQFGMPLRHYAQQYLFGATGLRLRVFHSIAGVPQSCKSPLLFDLMGHVCASQDTGGLGGIGFLYELEDKISPVLLSSVLSQYGQVEGKTFKVISGQTIEGALKHLTGVVLQNYKTNLSSCRIPLIIGLDSIGGSASQDTVDKINAEGVAGKGYYNKAHFMKYLCENMGSVMGNIPMVVVCINQEKEQAASTPYGPPQKKITGGVSQVYKDGHMISTTFKTLASGDGKIVTMRTTKTSFCDPRKIEVAFRWNKYGKSEDDAYGHHFEWAMASAKCIADPEKGVGEIRDICDVKISDQGLVTCPQLDCKSVKPEEFEASLMSEEHADVLNALRVYQKIDRIKGLEDYAEYVKKLKSAGKPEKETVVKPEKKAAKKTLSKPLFGPETSSEQPAQQETTTK